MHNHEAIMLAETALEIATQSRTDNYQTAIQEAKDLILLQVESTAKRGFTYLEVDRKFSPLITLYSQIPEPLDSLVEDLRSAGYAVEILRNMGGYILGLRIDWDPPVNSQMRIFKGPDAI